MAKIVGGILDHIHGNCKASKNYEKWNKNHTHKLDIKQNSTMHFFDGGITVVKKQKGGGG